ncbi:MAG: hypothetical protein ACRDLL_03535 [Solirubrobacterales bacterium]
MNQQKTGVRAEVLGRITVAPRLARTLDGVAICRFTVATEVGPASRPLVKPIYVQGNPSLRPSEDLPVRIKEKLQVGDLVYVPGYELQRPRKRRGVEYIESAIAAQDVRLRERGEVRGG